MTIHIKKNINLKAVFLQTFTSFFLKENNSQIANNKSLFVLDETGFVLWEPMAQPDNTVI